MQDQVRRVIDPAVCACVPGCAYVVKEACLYNTCGSQYVVLYCAGGACLNVSGVAAAASGTAVVSTATPV